jgi:penicillin-binding protein 2
MRWRRFRKRRQIEIAPDEILLDSENLPDFDRDRFEGRLERPLSRRSLSAAGTVAVLVVAAMFVRAGQLQLVQGAEYAEQAEENQLAETVLFADRGEIVDRNGVSLAYNERTSVADDFATRVYAAYRGIAHVVGYVRSPQKDSSGFYYRNSYEGVDGAEENFNQALAGVNGLKLTETDARGKVVSEATTRPPQTGQRLVLSIDANVSEGLYSALATRAVQANAQGAAGVIMDVRTGELLSLVSYPEFSPEAMVSGDKAAIAAYNSDKRLPFLDRAVDGLYAPGSIIKPVMAAAALQEGVITERTLITSTGQLTLPNPYDPSKPTIFKDWRVNGTMTVRDAIAVSSDVFFYEVGGGFQNQKGIGISNIAKYFKLFGYGSDAGLDGFSSKMGTVPTPEWKAATFPNDPTWRVGNTYHTAIGQYGMQVTPLQAVREASAVANGGTLLKPTLLASSTPQGTKIPIDAYNLQVAREGMRQGVTKGIATAINFSFVQPAAKTGTAEVGVHKEYQNAWMIGFWPYDNPKYAFAVVMEKLPAGTMVGGAAVMSDFFIWMRDNAPQYLE